MARLPVVGGDVDQWGTLVNDYHNANTGYSPHNYGAYGDGTTNDQTAIANAIAACPAGGRVVFDGSKTYAIGGTSYGILVNKAVTISLNGATLKRTASGYEMVRVAASGVIIDGGGGMIDGNRSGGITGSQGIVIAAGTNSTTAIRNLRVKSCSGAGIYALTDTQTVTIQDVEVWDCLSSVAHNAPGISIANAGTLRLNNVYCHDNDGWGVQFSGTSTAHDCGLIRVNRNVTGGVSLGAGTRGRIAQIQCSDNRSYGVLIASAADDWIIGSIQDRDTGRAAGGNYVDGSGPDLTGSAVVTSGNRIQIGTITSRQTVGYALAFSGCSDCEVGAVVADALAAGDSDPGIAFLVGAARNNVGVASAKGFTYGAIFAEGSAVSYNTIGVLETTACSYGAVAFRAGSQGNIVGTLIDRDSYTSVAGDGLIHFKDASTASNFVGHVTQSNPTANKPDYVVRSDASASGNYVYGGLFTVYNTAPWLDSNGGNYFISSHAGGGLRIGAPAAYGRLGQKFEVNQSANFGGAALTTWAADATSAPALDFNKSRSATIGTPAIIQNGDALGYLEFRGSDGGAFQTAASIRGFIDATPGANDIPGRLAFLTAPDGTASVVERLRIDNKGNVVLNASGSALAASATAGFTYIPAGTTHGTPGTLYTGAVPMYYDTGSNQIWVYTASAWYHTVPLTTP
jgi:hypothetical protein